MTTSSSSRQATWCSRCDGDGYIEVSPEEALRLEAEREEVRLVVHGLSYILARYLDPHPASIADFWQRSPEFNVYG